MRNAERRTAGPGGRGDTSTADAASGRRGGRHPDAAKRRRGDPSTSLLCGCQVTTTRVLFWLFHFLTKERLAAMRGTAQDRHTALGCAPLSGRTDAPGSLSQGPNRQEVFAPGSACRRGVPWGRVSSWVKGVECTRHPSYKSQGRPFDKHVLSTVEGLRANEKYSANF